jgi:hypothetical protein
MRSYGVNSSRLAKAVEEEWKAKEDEFFQKCKTDIIPQILAVSMFSLETRFDFSKEDIQDFYHDVVGTLTLGDIFGRSMNVEDLIADIKEKYDIDLDGGDL